MRDGASRKRSLPGWDRTAAEGGEALHAGGREGAVEDGDGADPAGEADAGAGVDNAANDEGAAVLGAGGGVEVVGGPGRVDAEGGEFALADEGEADLGEGVLAEFDALFGGIREDRGFEGLTFGGW